MLRDMFHELQPGDWCFEGSVLWLRIPDGEYVRIPLGLHGWSWDGNFETPTLNPSINVIGHWHGWMKQGRLETV